MEKQQFNVEGTTVYSLEFCGYRNAEPQYSNRVYAQVQGSRNTTVEELEATAHLFAAAPELLSALKGILNDAKFGIEKYGFDPDKDQGIIDAIAAIAKAEGK